MNRTSRRGISLAVLLVGLASWAAFALPSFSDQNIAAGNPNPTGTAKVMEIRASRHGGEDVTICRPPGVVLPLVLQHHPNCPLANLRRVSA